MFKLMKHFNQYGYGLSLTKYKDPKDSLSLETGFVLNTFPDKEDRDKYYLELKAMTGFEDDQHLE